MSIVTNKFKIIYLSLIVILIVTTKLEGQNFSLKNIQAYFVSDTLKVDLSIQNLFREKIKKTLFSGLPLLIDLTLELIDSQGKTVLIKVFNGRISYDVWEEMFSVTGISTSRREFQSLKTLSDWSNNIKGLIFIASKNLSDDELYRINLELSVTLLTRRQSQKLKSWLESSSQTEEELPTQDRSTGFKLNLSRLLQVFIRNKDEEEKYTATGFTEFQIEDEYKQ